MRWLVGLLRVSACGAMALLPIGILGGAVAGEPAVQAAVNCAAPQASAAAAGVPLDAPREDRVPGWALLLGGVAAGGVILRRRVVPEHRGLPSRPPAQALPSASETGAAPALRSGPHA